jgi:pimeloyl-ACP methyl ester carboxylesterase
MIAKGIRMTLLVDPARLYAVASADLELRYKLRGLTATARLAIGANPLDILIVEGAVTGVRPAQGEADVTISAPDAFWADGLSAPVPPPGTETLTMGFQRGVAIEGDFPSLVAAYQGAWQRLYLVLRAAVCGAAPRHPDPEPFRETDNAVGRYAYVKANGGEARIYYEEAGHGEVPLLLLHTAGADARQYRYLLADPQMQKRFTMYAYDLPCHGKSLPPLGDRWWETGYHPTRETIMNWTVGLTDRLGLDQPFFMGCSVGGQLALDLAAFHGDRFGAFISLNGWYDNPQPSKVINNDTFRTPAISEDFPMSIILGGTAPQAPEASAQEVYWIYRSNFPGVYAGDNDYFMHEHDLKQYGDRIDAQAKPVYVVCGEYDSAAHDADHGGPAVARNVPGAVYIEAKGLGHFAPSDDPVGFSAMIVPVLDAILEKAAASGNPLLVETRESV